MKPRKWFLRIYLVVALIYGFLGLSDNLSTIFNVGNNIYTQFLILVSFCFFFFNLIALAFFHYHRVEKLAYILPIYHLATYLLFLILGFILISIDQVPLWSWTALVVLGNITSLFEIFFSIFLLRRIDFTQN